MMCFTFKTSTKPKRQRSFCGKHTTERKVYYPAVTKVEKFESDSEESITSRQRRLEHKKAERLSTGTQLFKEHVLKRASFDDKKINGQSPSSLTEGQIQGKLRFISIFP